MTLTASKIQKIYRRRQYREILNLSRRAESKSDRKEPGRVENVPEMGRTLLLLSNLAKKAE